MAVNFYHVQSIDAAACQLQFSLGKRSYSWR